jgi:hypothetical protein
LKVNLANPRILKSPFPTETWTFPSKQNGIVEITSLISFHNLDAHFAILESHGRVQPIATFPSRAVMHKIPENFVDERSDKFTEEICSWSLHSHGIYPARFYT